MYYFSETLDKTFEETVFLAINALKKEGLGINTEINVKASLEKKLNINFHKYKIIGACHPRIAYQILQIDNKAGTLFPCNLIVQEQPNGSIEVSSINPIVMFQAINNPKVEEIAIQASQIMQAVMTNINQDKLST